MQVELSESTAWKVPPGKTMRPGGFTITEQMFTRCPLPPKARVLDMGCGVAATLNYIKSRFALDGYGLDQTAVLLHEASSALPHLRLAQGQAEHLPIRSECMDAVIAECALSIFQTEAALAEAARVLKCDGYLLASDMYVRNENDLDPLHRLPPDSYIHHTLPQACIQEKVAAAGFQIVAWQDCSDQLKKIPYNTPFIGKSVDPFDFLLAATRARLGYYFLVAKKVSNG